MFSTASNTALQDRIELHQTAFNAACVGRSFDVLFDKPGRHFGQLVGRSPYLQPVNVTAPSWLIGEIAAVRITGVGPNSLFGALRAEPEPSPERIRQLAFAGIGG